ncbi:MAG: fibronectin type III domain-containing protein [Elusimicrobia bacterium]|nr:fibronectin type III domain-containing protein [Elusimicrobiota bacterium]
MNLPRVRFMLKSCLTSFWLVFSFACFSFAAGLNPITVSISAGSANFNWNGIAPQYAVVLSSVSDFSAILDSGTLANNTTSYPDLNPNTIYYFGVKKTTETAYEEISTTTYAKAPLGPEFISNFFTAVSSDDATVNINWSVNGNPEYTDYVIDVSTETFPNSNTGNFSTTEPYPPVDIGNLNANTTYFFQIKALNLDLIPTTYTSAISSSTLAIDTSLTEFLTYETSVTIKWIPVQSANKAEDSEGYSLILTTSPIYDSILNSSSISDNSISSATFTSLKRNTTHYFKLGALNSNKAANYNNSENFTTLTKEPLGFSIISISSDTSVLGWAAFPGAPLEDSAMGYILEASSTNFASSAQIISSTTYALSQSALTLSNLNANTTYYFRIGALNTANDSHYTQVLSTVTLTLQLSKELISATASSTSVNANYNPLVLSPQEYACNGYILQASTADFSAGGIIYSSSTALNTVDSLTIKELWPNTTYYLRLGALNRTQTPIYTQLDAMITELPPPLSSVTFENIWQSSATVLFSSANCDGYVMQASTYQYFNYIAAENSTTNSAATSLSLEGLNANTEYYFRAGILFNGATVYTRTNPEEASTLSRRVSAPALANVFYSSITINWTPLDLSPSSSTAEGYVLESSLYPDFSAILYSSQTSVISVDRLSIKNLLSNTTYFFRIGTINWNNEKNYTQAPTTATLANIPIQQDYDLTMNSMKLNWLTNSNPTDTLYTAEISSNSDYSPLLASSSTKNGFAEFTGLTPNTTHYSKVTAFNRFNVPTGPLEFSAMATLAYNPAYDDFTDLGTSSVTLQWGAGLNPAGTKYIAEISSSSSFAEPVFSSVTQNTSAHFASLIPNTSYQLRVSAYNHTNVPTPATSLLTALTYPTTPYALPSAETFTNFMYDGFTVNWQTNGNSLFTVYNIEISSKSDFSVLTASSSTIGTSLQFGDLSVNTTYWARIRAEGLTQIKTDFINIGSTITLSGIADNALYNADSTVTLETSYGDISLFAPSGSFGGSTVITIEPIMSFAPAISEAASLKETGIGINVTQRPEMLVLKALTLTIPYKISYLPIGVDRSKLVVALYDDINNVWAPLPSVSDTLNNTVSAQTWHLSTFQIMEITPGQSLDNVKIYPNPYRPSSITDVMHFTNLPPSAKIEIYTILGEFIKKIKTGAGGTAYWEGLNKSGRKVASGVYLAVIHAPDGKTKKLLKVAIER